MSVAVISDVHGVLHALDKVLEQECLRTADRIVALGDIAAGPQPNEVMDRLAGLGDRVCWITGNADREMVEFRSGACLDLPDPMYRWAADQLSAEHLAALARHPLAIHIDIENLGPTMFCHATPRQDDEVVLVDSRYARWDEVLTDVPPSTQTIVLGHTHMQFARPWRGRIVVNPGSIGLPFGRPGPHWAMLGQDIRLMRLDIDPEEACRSVCRGSAFPGVAEWADRHIRRRDSDAAAMASFGMQDGRLHGG